MRSACLLSVLLAGCAAHTGTAAKHGKTAPAPEEGRTIDVFELAERPDLYAGRTVPVIVPRWRVEGEVLVAAHEFAEERGAGAKVVRRRVVFHLGADDLARVRRLDAGRHDNLVVAGRCGALSGGEVHLRACRLVGVEESLTDWFGDIAGQAGNLKPAKGR